MPTPVPADPADATLSQAITVVRSTWAPNLDLIFRGCYSFWLGSAISSSRFDGVDALIRGLLFKLRTLSNGSPSCPYRKALTQIVQRTSLTPAEISSIDFTQAPPMWPRIDEIVRQLRNHYSAILAIPILDPAGALSIPWDVLKLQSVYSDDSKQPDAEHRCLAAMIEEGFLSNLVTTNWDPLIEKAHKACRGGKTEELDVVACNDDLNRGQNGATPRLFKIHGCARKAVADPDHYQHFMVATADEIANWENVSGPLAEASRALLRETCALFVGLSGQDFDLKTLFARVQVGRSAPYPLSPARVVFCTTGLSADQYAILKLIYGEKTYSHNASLLVEGAALPLYAKPLLGSVYLLGLRAKIESLLGRGKAEIPPPFLEMAQRVVNNTEQRLCHVFDAITPADDRWRVVVERVSRFVSRLMALYLGQKLDDPDTYEPLSSINISKIENLSAAAMGDLHWLFLALSCILEGERRGFWVVEAPVDRSASEGQLILRNGGDAVSVFLLNRSIYRSRLENNVLNPTLTPNPVLLLYPADTVPRTSTRMPEMELPGAHVDPDELIEVSLQEVLVGTTTEDALLDALHKEFAAARRTW